MAVDNKFDWGKVAVGAAVVLVLGIAGVLAIARNERKRIVTDVAPPVTNRVEHE